MHFTDINDQLQMQITNYQGLKLTGDAGDPRHPRVKFSVEKKTNRG